MNNKDILHILSSNLLHTLYPNNNDENINFRKNTKIVSNYNNDELIFDIYLTKIDNNIYNIIKNIKNNLTNIWGNGRIYKYNDNYYTFGKNIEYIFIKSNDITSIDNIKYINIGKFIVKFYKINYISYIDYIVDDILMIIYEKLIDPKDAKNISELITNDTFYKNIIYKKYNYLYKDIDIIISDIKKLKLNFNKYTYKNYYNILFKIHNKYQNLFIPLRNRTYQSLLKIVNKNEADLMILVKIYKEYPYFYIKIMNNRFIDIFNYLYIDLQNIKINSIFYDYVKTGKIKDGFILTSEHISLHEPGLFILPQLLIDDGLVFNDIDALIKMLIFMLPGDINEYIKFISSKLSKDGILKIIKHLELDINQEYINNKDIRVSRKSDNLYEILKYIINK